MLSSFLQTSDLLEYVLLFPFTIGAVLLAGVVIWFLPLVVIGMSFNEITKRWNSHGEDGFKGVMLNVWSVWPWVLWSLIGMLWVRFVSFRLLE